MPLLPGVNTTIKSNKLKELVSGGPATKRILIIGMAQDGPVNTPRRVTDLADAALLFGPANYSGGYFDPNTSSESLAAAGTSIPESLAQAVAAGCQDIWVCRAGGTYATAPTAFGSKLDIRSLYPGRIYNRVSLTLATTGGAVEIYLNQPAAKGGNVQLLPNLPASGTVQSLIDKINTDTRNKTIRLNPYTFSSILSSAAYTAIGSGTVTLTGGTNGCRARGDDYGPESATGVAGFATKLLTVDTGTFDTLEGMSFAFDYCVLTGIYADDQIVDAGQTKIGGSGTYTATDEYTTTIAYDFQTWLARMSSAVYPCRGNMACRPPLARDQEALISYINNNLLATTHAKYDSNLRWLKMGPFLYEGFTNIDYQTGTTFDGGSRLSLIAGTEVVVYHKDRGNFTDMGHVLYGAKLTTMPPERGMVLQPLDGVLAFGEYIPRKYADKLISGVGFDSANQLSGKGAYVVLVKDPANFNGPLVVYSDCTTAARDDYFAQDQLIHLVNSVAADLNKGLRGFLGGPTDIQAITAMKTRARTILDGYSGSGALRGFEGQGYTFEISLSEYGSITGVIDVSVELNPATVARQIRLNLSVRNVA